MATRISDIYNPVQFDRAISQIADGQYTFLASGLVAADARLNTFLAGPGDTIELPLYGAVDAATTWNVSTDDPASNATPDKLGSAPQRVARLARNASWAEMNLARELAGQSALSAVEAGAGGAIAANRQSALISMLVGTHDPVGGLGIFSSDLVFSGTGPFSIDALADGAAQIFNGRYDGTETLVVNPATYAEMMKEVGAAKVTIPVNGLNVTVNMYGGHPVVIDKDVPTGVTFIGKAGSVSAGSNGVSSWMDSSELAGNGGGMQFLGVRESMSYAIMGASYTGSVIGTAAGVGAPTDSDFANTANWSQLSTLTDVSKVGIGAIYLA